MNKLEILRGAIMQFGDYTHPQHQETSGSWVLDVSRSFIICSQLLEGVAPMTVKSWQASHETPYTMEECSHGSHCASQWKEGGGKGGTAIN